MYLISSLSELGFTGWLVVLVAFLVSRWVLARISSKNRPPGPLSLPIVGSLLSMPGKDLRESLARLAVKYGDVMQIDLGLTRAVVLNSYDAMKESLIKQGHMYVYRPKSLVSECRTDLGVSAQNKYWESQKRFIHHSFRDSGLGKNTMELIIQDELSILVEAMSQDSKTSDISNYFNKVSLNVVLRLVLGRSYPYDDPLIVRHATVLNELSILGEKSLKNCFPFLRYLPGDLTDDKRVTTLLLELKGIAVQWIEERKKTIEYDGPPRDFIEAYLQERRRRDNNPETEFTDEMLAWHILDIRSAGVEAVAVTLVFFVYRMILHPEVQEKVHKEVDEVVGSRQPSLHDRSKMPYTEATLSEVQRLADVSRMGLPHANDRETEIKGYNIPQWTYIMLNICYVHRDPKVWTDPEKFDPDRFLDQFGKFTKKDELIPFGLGKRNCLGETLARSELFLIAVAIMQHFSFRIPDGGAMPDPEGKMGFIVHPKPVDVVMESRSTK